MITFAFVPELPLHLQQHRVNPFVQHPFLRCSLDLEDVAMTLVGLAAETSARQPRVRTTAIPRPASESPFGRKPKEEEKQENGGK